MKRTRWIITMLVASVSLCGCGGEEKESSNATAQRQTPTVTPDQSVGTAIASANPKEAVGSFLEALRTGDKSTTEAMLTRKAREETAAHDLVVEPPGAPDATYTIGQVQEVEGDAGAAYVSCIWSEKQDQAEFEVVWILRQETQGWRIAGMATRLPESDEPIILNFEDLSELEEAMQEAEIAQQPNNTPQDPQSTTVR